MNTSIAVRDSARGASFFASFTRTLRVTSRCLLVLLLALLASSAWAASTTVVISQLYGGGGNSGATYNTKYVELFNLSASPQSLNGMSLQYGSKSGTTWSRFTLPNVSLAPGQYYLVQVGSGSSGSPLPVTPDTTTTSITPAAAGGKMVLMGDTSTFTGACPSGAVVDFIGYGTSASNQANCSEPITTPASANNVPDLSATTAAIRSNHGCTDTDNNAADFSVSVPSPHNSQTTANPCGGSTNPAVAAKSATPAPAGGSSTLSVTVTPGTNPASTGLSVTVDLTNIGGVNNFVLYDDGTHGDAVAGDNVFTATANVGASVTPNNYPLPITVRDFQLRTAAAVLINITVIPPPVAKTIMEIQGHGARSSFAGSGSVLGTTYVITPSGS
ncbi:MAG: lamin tail domain-containing protein, partial [Proteobacteria bacterium]|nr:lamin tail domain-containing protein [Pseudomonadota bacterium]